MTIKGKQIVVAALIENPKGEVLLIKRNDRGTSPNFWEDVGGRLNQSEEPEEGLKREIYEETGIQDIEIIKPIEKLKNQKLILLAEKVETNEEFQVAMDMGFSHFQGYFFCKPEILKGKEISSHSMNLLTVIAEANKSDFDFTHLDSR